MIGYYRKFIPHNAHLAKLLGDLALSHPKQFKWTNEHETCFRYLKEPVKKHARLHLPDATKPYYVQTDASDFCGARRAFQKDEEGDEKIHACVSRMFTKTECTYSTVKKRSPSTALHPQNNGFLPEICSQNHHPSGRPSHPVSTNVQRINRNPPQVLNRALTV